MPSVYWALWVKRPQIISKVASQLRQPYGSTKRTAGPSLVDYRPTEYLSDC